MKFKEYLPLHEEIYPRPPKKSLGLGWAFWAAVSVAVAAIVLAALRTAHSFYLAAVLSTQVYGVESPLLTAFMSYTEAAAAMLAIEGGIVYGAVKRAKFNGKINPRVSTIYIGMLVLISIIAGLGQSLPLVLGLPEDIMAGFSWILAIVLGVGASVIAWLSGEMLGVEMLKFEEARRNIEAAFQRASTKWLSDARTHWYEAGKAKQDDSPSRIRTYVDQVVFGKGVVPTAGEIGKALGLTEGYVRGVMEEMRATIK